MGSKIKIGKNGSCEDHLQFFRMNNSSGSCEDHQLSHKIKNSRGSHRDPLQSLKLNSSGQLTLFVIIGLVIVFTILLIVYFMNQQNTTINPTKNPVGYIEQCVSKLIVPVISEIDASGGLRTPKNFLTYKTNKIEYLCYTAENKTICTNTQPMMKEQIESEIYDEIKSQVETCFSNLEASFKGYDYQAKPTSLVVTVEPSQIIAKITKEISLTKGDQYIQLKDFTASINDPSFDFLVLSNRILNNEVSCVCGKESCTADMLKLSQENLDYDLRVYVSGRNEKVYTITELNTGKEFNFAVRNCITI